MKENFKRKKYFKEWTNNYNSERNDEKWIEKI